MKPYEVNLKNGSHHMVNIPNSTLNVCCCTENHKMSVCTHCFIQMSSFFFFVIMYISSLVSVQERMVMVIFVEIKHLCTVKCLCMCFEFMI